MAEKQNIDLNYIEIESKTSSVPARQIENGRTTPPPYMEDLEIGVISGHDGYYRNYYEDHNNYYGQGQGHDYGQGDYQRPDYDTQQYISIQM